MLNNPSKDRQRSETFALSKLLFSSPDPEYRNSSVIFGAWRDATKKPRRRSTDWFAPSREKIDPVDIFEHVDPASVALHRYQDHKGIGQHWRASNLDYYTFITKHSLKVEERDVDQVASRHLTPITNFPNEPYEVIIPIPVSYTYFAADDVVASFSEANISWSDEGGEKARQGLKIEILNAIELYEENEHNLDWGPKRQLTVLREYVRRIPSE